MLLHCFDNDFENNLENNAWNYYLEHNAVELQEILNRIMQRIMSIITSALSLDSFVDLSSQLTSSLALEAYCPLSISQWSQELHHHPDKAFSSYILQGIEFGFRIGFDRSQALPVPLHSTYLLRILQLFQTI